MPRHDIEALRVIYDDAGRLVEGWSCEDSADCCRFDVTGREPYLWPPEWELLSRAISARGLSRTRSRLAIAGACPLLDRDGRCTVYEARPFGCRTFFCDRARGPQRRPPRAALAELGRRIATLSERAEPGAGPRPLTRLIG